MSNKFISIDRDTLFVIPVQDWLSEAHLARFNDHLFSDFQFPLTR